MVVIRIRAVKSDIQLAYANPAFKRKSIQALGFMSFHCLFSMNLIHIPFFLKLNLLCVLLCNCIRCEERVSVLTAVQALY